MKSPRKWLADSTTTAKPPQQAPRRHLSNRRDYVNLHTQNCDAVHTLELGSERSREFVSLSQLQPDRQVFLVAVYVSRSEQPAIRH